MEDTGYLRWNHRHTATKMFWLRWGWNIGIRRDWDIGRGEGWFRKFISKLLSSSWSSLSSTNSGICGSDGCSGGELGLDCWCGDGGDGGWHWTWVFGCILRWERWWCWMWLVLFEKMFCYNHFDHRPERHHVKIKENNVVRWVATFECVWSNGIDM